MKKSQPKEDDAMVILIPAYCPDLKLVHLVTEILSTYHVDVLIVDDGSGSEYAYIFFMLEQMNCTVIRHDRNYGKGRALKTGFQYVLEHVCEPIGVVTADADGQHLPGDIMKIAAAVRAASNEMVLGVRDFFGAVPLRSRIGNMLSRKIMKWISGADIRDTQTGLRGFPILLLPDLIQISGERFDYETNVLLWGLSHGITIRQIEIQTVYTHSGSRYKPFRDTIKIFRSFMKGLNARKR